MYNFARIYVTSTKKQHNVPIDELEHFVSDRFDIQETPKQLFGWINKKTGEKARVQVLFVAGNTRIREKYTKNTRKIQNTLIFIVRKYFYE